MAGARGRVKPGLARNFFEKSNIAPDVIGGQIVNGADAAISCNFELVDDFGDKFCSATPGLRPSVQNVWPVGNMFVRESESKFGRIERS